MIIDRYEPVDTDTVITRGRDVWKMWKKKKKMEKKKKKKKEERNWIK